MKLTNKDQFRFEIWMCLFEQFIQPYWEECWDGFRFEDIVEGLVKDEK